MPPLLLVEYHSFSGSFFFLAGASLSLPFLKKGCPMVIQVYTRYSVQRRLVVVIGFPLYLYLFVHELPIKL
ncbi:hypothetical protein BC941DRAFT_421367 [Chlamydoabsidia padenii]|nr:hypothetical protein BC941DRAFT_421367 [Chlamydoabsidia padenii]